MEDLVFRTSFFISVVFTGLLCGASLDQSIKQLPARRIIGAKAFSGYAKAADLKNGVPWYAVLGVGAALSSIMTAVLACVWHAWTTSTVLLVLSGLFAICHSVCTSLAAPLYHKQKKIEDEHQLELLLNKFSSIQVYRSVFIILNFLSLIVVIWINMG